MTCIIGGLVELIMRSCAIQVEMTSLLIERDRPRVVTAVGRLRMLAGILVMGFGLFMAISTERYLEFMGETLADYASLDELLFYSSFIGGIFIVQGIAGIIVALGIFAGKKWAWTANVVLSSILILLGAMDIALGELRSAIGVIFNAFILGYMFTRPVKLYFGKASLPTNPPASPASAPSV